MSYEFFFSYTRSNNSNYLRQFFNDLSEEVRELNGLPAGSPVGFFDQRDIELGSEWEEDILQALQDSKVLVSIYSPGYFKSAYCGREWRFFQMRRELYVKTLKAEGATAAELPPSIKPVLWVAPLPADLEPLVGALQYTVEDPHSVHNTEGLRYVLQKLHDYRSIYVDYVRRLAKSILQAGQAHPLPKLVPSPALADVSSSFKIAAPVPGPAVYSPKHVRFVFVAARPNEIADLRSIDPYIENGGADWKPFFPAETASIGPFVQHIASGSDLGFTSDELSLSANLIQEIEKAWEERKIVIILVDGWTVGWQAQYQQILRQFDQRNFYHCSVLVPWNDRDPENSAKREAIETAVRATFDFRANLMRNPIFFRDSIRSLDELREALRDVLVRIKAEIRNRADVARPIPHEITKPTISGVSAGESR